jgi:hypothetical protein
MTKNNAIPETPASPKPPTAEEIAELAGKGKDVSRFFTGKGKMMPPKHTAK